MTTPTSDKEKLSLGIFLILLFCLFYLIVNPFIMILIVAATIVILTYPLYDKLLATRPLNRHPKLTALITMIAILLIIILPLTLVSSIIVDRVYTIVQDIDFRESFQSILTSDFYLNRVEPFFHLIEDRFDTKINLLDYLTRFIRGQAFALYGYSPKFVLGTASYVFQFIVMLVTIYFLYCEGPRLFKFLIGISPLSDAHEKLLVLQFRATIRATIYGMIVTSFVQATLAFFGYVICSVPSAFILAALTFCLSMIPFIGTTGIWVPVSVWLFLQGEVKLGAFLFIYGLVVVGGIDNILKPVLIRGKTKSHPLLIFFSIIGGISFMGPIGLIFGPVILALLIETIMIYRREVLHLDASKA